MQTCIQTTVRARQHVTVPCLVQQLADDTAWLTQPHRLACWVTCMADTSVPLKVTLQVLTVSVTVVCPAAAQRDVQPADAHTAPAGGSPPQQANLPGHHSEHHRCEGTELSYTIRFSTSAVVVQDVGSTAVRQFSKHSVLLRRAG